MTDKPIEVNFTIPDAQPAFQYVSKQFTTPAAMALLIAGGGDGACSVWRRIILAEGWDETTYIIKQAVPKFHDGELIRIDAVLTQED